MSEISEDKGLNVNLIVGEEHIVLKPEFPLEEKQNLPIFKKSGRRWKTLPEKGDDVTIRDPKLKQGYLGDLQKKTVIELEDAIRRQDMIMNNKDLLSKLPDKGERLRIRRKEISDALQEAKDREKNMTSAELPVDIQALEWRDIKGSVHQTVSQSINTCQQSHNNCIDSDDDEQLDPLELMAHHSSSVKKHIHRKSWSDEEDPAAIISRELQQMELRDAQESAEVKTERRETSKEENIVANGCTPVQGKSALDFGTKRIQMLEMKRMRNGEIRQSFKPFRRVADPQPIPDLQKIIESHRPKSETKVQLISLQESITLEREYLAKMKERELKRTTHALSRMKGENIKIGLPPSSSAKKYRDINVTDHLLDSDEEDYCYLPADSEYDFEEYFDDN